MSFARRLFSLFFVLVLYFPAVTTFAQKKTVNPPSWTIKEPDEKNTHISIAKVEKTLKQEVVESSQPQSIFSVKFVAPKGVNFADSAKYQAFYKFTQILPWDLNKNSLLYELASYGIEVSNIENALIKLMYNAPEFKLRGTWETESDLYCYYSITTDAFSQFLSRISYMALTQADSLYTKGLENKRKGQPYSAANCFAQALNILQPLCFRIFPVADREIADLGHEVLEEYLNVYQGITVEPSFPAIPAAFGEPIPAKLKLRVCQNGTPLRNIPIITQVKADKVSDSHTDIDGFVMLSIKKITSSDPKQKVLFEIDRNSMLDVTPTIAEELFKKQTFPTASIDLDLFDPSIFVKIEMPDFDSTLVAKVQETISSQRRDMMIVNDKGRADIIFRICQDTKVERQLDYDKVSLNLFSTNLKIDVILRSNNSIIDNFTIDDYKYTAKTPRSQEKVFHSISRLLSRLLNDDFESFVRGIKYDKRGVIWEKFTKG